jgi:hypothetical protein
MEVTEMYHKKKINLDLTPEVALGGTAVISSDAQWEALELQSRSSPQDRAD